MESWNKNRDDKPHAIMISFHLQGHIIPFVNLALKLASKGFSITFAHLEYIHHRISKSQSTSTDIDVFAKARASGLDIRYTRISDGFPVEFDRAANFNLHLESYLQRFPGIVDEFVGEVTKARSSSCPGRCFLIADTFCVWHAQVAKNYGLVDVSFWTEPALVFSLYYHLELLRKNGHVPVKARQENVDYVPGIKSINTKDFMSYFQDEELQLLHKIIFRAFDLVKEADFVLCNTVQELEPEAISALQEKQPFYAIGPVFQADFGNSPVFRSLWPESNCTDWLNSKPRGSVLYVSFGSLAKVERSVVLEIAAGLSLSVVNFIWVLRPGIVDPDDEKGLLDGVRDRGLIVPWCTQNQVLTNPAVGGFLTHCGWNSVLESIWCGIPMICYPLFSDQMTNRKLVVDDWKVGMNLCDGKSITREEVAEKIRILMSGERSDELRHEIGKMKRTLDDALAREGSSEKNFDCFVSNVLAEIQGRCAQKVILTGHDL